jgi:uncharacterized protein YdcH (DUF465 family)
MSHTPHDIAEDFPGQADTISRLKTTDAHFAHLLDAYHTANRAVHRAETRVEPMSEQAEADLRRERAKLKDQIARHLGQAA